MWEKTAEIISSFFIDNAPNFSKETARSYSISLRQFFRFAKLEYDQVKADTIRHWLITFSDQGLKPRTVALKFAALKSFYNYCMEEGLVEHNPTINIKKPKFDSSPSTVYLNMRELALLREHTKDKVRERAIIETLYATGMRIKELVNLKLEDIDWESRRILVTDGKGNKRRYVLFNIECAIRLEAYLKQRKIDSPYLFPNHRGEPISQQLVQKIFRDLSDELGFKVTPHTLRRTFGAHLAERDVPKIYIQQLLGHTNINTTRIYTELNQEARKRKYESYEVI